MPDPNLPLTGDEGGLISLAVAATYTASYRSAYPNLPKAQLFGVNIIQAILSQQGTVAVRFYAGIDAAGQQQLIMVGVDAQGNDQTSLNIADFSIHCPPLCGEPNLLNGL